MEKSKLVLTSLALLLVTFTAVNAALISSTVISSSGIVASEGISVYSEATGTYSVSHLYWGKISVNNTITRSIYVRNDGATAVSLQVLAIEHVPAEASVLVFTSNCEEAVILQGETFELVMTLTLPEQVAFTVFSFNIRVDSAAIE